ncbi:MAG: DUF6279 family lipoprotein [Pseudomonadota bacterium]
MKKRAVILCLGLLVLSGCSGTTFLYNRLNIILPWMLGDYVDLDREQKSYFKTELEPFLEWHRMDELPRYATLLSQMDSVLDDAVTEDEIQGIVTDFEAAWLRLETRGLELLIGLGEQLSDEQMNQFLDALDEEQESYGEKYLSRSDEEYYEDARDSFIDTAEDFMGRLSREQKSLIESGVGALLRSDDIWVQERGAWNERLAVILQRAPGWQQALRDAVAARERDISPDYRDTYRHNSAALQATLVDLMNSRSAAQDRKLRKKLAGYREDFEELNEQGLRRMARAAAS